ncbi:hypothetical protein [Algibacter mikhailovii]|uniref:hypothetical protein n=1 Tax=Algibacter mikhailovii TaxID=425498 RepID=UPI0024959A7E|nr:hypothetical protein [Algibacter mikhailovii]
MHNIKFNILALILSSAFILSCSNDDGDTQDTLYLEIPDQHFESILIGQGIDSDGTINQQMLKTDAENIKRLDLNLSAHFGEIRDLTGIEGFTDLSFLSAAGQKIKAVNLSSNTKLDTLYLNGNHLTHMDISNNPNLILIDFQANAISTIQGLATSKKLKKANLSFNNFETISINNASLEVLIITHNLLKSIDTQDALHLKNVLAISNQLTGVDFSSNIGLETLVISGNKLQNINLENNTRLTHLYSSSNLLTSLDVSNNKQLIDLRVDRNPDLTCIKIENGQNIPIVSLSEYQDINTICN